MTDTKKDSEKQLKPSELLRWKEAEKQKTMKKVDIKRPQDYLWHYSLSKGMFIPHRKPTVAERAADKFNFPVLA